MVNELQSFIYSTSLSTNKYPSTYIFWTIFNCRCNLNISRMASTLHKGIGWSVIKEKLNIYLFLHKNLLFSILVSPLHWLSDLSCTEHEWICQKSTSFQIKNYSIFRTFCKLEFWRVPLLTCRICCANNVLKIDK